MYYFTNICDNIARFYILHFQITLLFYFCAYIFLIYVLLRKSSLSYFRWSFLANILKHCSLFAFEFARNFAQMRQWQFSFQLCYSVWGRPQHPVSWWAPSALLWTITCLFYSILYIYIIILHFLLCGKWKSVSFSHSNMSKKDSLLRRHPVTRIILVNPSYMQNCNWENFRCI